MRLPGSLVETANDPTVVAGAGIAGLAISLLLARSGRSVVVYEQAEAPFESGAGIQITPNGMRVLSALGLYSEVRKCGVPARWADLVEHISGSKLLQLDLSLSGGGSAAYTFCHRADLVRLLANAATAEGASVRLGCRVEAVLPESSGIAISLADGAVIKPSLLIGADGINSVVRRFLNPDEPPIMSNHIAWRGTIPSGTTDALGPGHVRVIVGPNRHIVLYRPAHAGPTNMVAVRRFRRAFPYGRPQDEAAEALVEQFSGFGGGVKEILKGAENVSRWTLAETRTARRWSGNGAVLAGDALHPVLPFLAQGGNLALEDAWVLCRMLEMHDDMPSALAAFRRKRNHRVNRVARATNFQGRLYHSTTTGPRNLLLRTLAWSTRLVPGLASMPVHWIHREDVTLN